MSSEDELLELAIVLDSLSPEQRDKEITRFLDKNVFRRIILIRDLGQSGRLKEGQQEIRSLLDDIMNNLRMYYVYVYRMMTPRFQRTVQGFIYELTTTGKFGEEGKKAWDEAQSRLMESAKKSSSVPVSS